MAGGATWRRRVGGLLAATALLSVPVAMAAAEEVRVRAATHPAYGRMVFDWPQRVEYDTRLEGDRLIVTFDRPITPALDEVVRRLPGYVAAARPGDDGRSVEFSLARPVSLRAFRNGTHVALDLRPEADALALGDAGRTPARVAQAPTAPAPTAPAPTAPSPAVTPAPAAPAPASPAPVPARATPPAAAQPSAGTVRVRAADHAAYSRLVFDWPAQVGYSVQRDGRSVTLLFDRPAAADLSQVARARLRNVTNAEQFRTGGGALAVTFSAPPDGDVRDFRNGNAVVVDVYNPGTRTLPAEATAPAAAEPPPPAAPGQPPIAAPAPAQAPAPAPVRAAVPPAPPAVAPAAPPPPPGATTTTVRPGSNDPGAATSPAAVPPAAPSPSGAAGAQVAAAPGSDTAQPGPTAGPTLVFDTGGPASAAVYPRAGHIYFVFDRAMPIGAGAVVGPGADQVGPIEPVPATGGTVFRTRTGPFVWPQIERRGTVWRITPKTRLTAEPPTNLRIDPEPDFLLGARLLVRAADAASVVQFTDPDVGDRLHVVPLPTPGQAVTDPYRLVDLEVLPSFQGVVVRPIADAVTVRPVREGVELTAAGGLHLSSVADAGSAAAAAETAAAPAAGVRTPAPGGASSGPAAPAGDGGAARARRLFELEPWQRGGFENFTTARQDLQMGVAEAPDGERPRAQLDLARFYFANGFGPEALGILDIIRTAQPDLDGWPAFRALRGGARFLAGNLDGAEADLSDPGLADEPEAALWRAAVAAERGDWATAARGFRTGGALLRTYPEPLLARLSLLAAEAALTGGDVAEAKRLLDRIEQRVGPEANERADIQYLRGELYRQTGETDRALEEWRAAYAGLDRYHRAKAGLALINLEVLEGLMSPASAVEKLAGLTFAWRGDDLEIAIRQRLGEMQMAAGQYAEGFETMKETAALVADTPKAERIAAEMQRQFADLYKDGAAHLPTLDALQLYDRFRELTPVGAEGDRIIRQLAERLIDIDLLGRAADLLQHQVEYRLAGEQKADVGTRLATVRLLDAKPDLALHALEMSNVPGMPPQLKAERRIMQAKALAEMGRANEALQLLAEDDSREANLLRVDIAWRAQNWNQASVALGKIIGPAPAPGAELDPNESQLVLNRAVALALAGDATGLGLLRKEFGPAMEASADADAFRVLTRPDQAAGLIDVNTIRSRVAEVDVFQKFLKGYKGRQAAPATN
ncbi:tetratricopeptide repeat protein [Azospirillum halopraeferens]|uniref:tetratricopeptide repeat protein n=1 Tax=Azospirillum halopraeferens TaxID=34010 RepID=UPI000412D02A|nr:membrane protein [Azospirillum halopraeferens]